MNWMHIAALSLILVKHSPSLLRRTVLARLSDADEFALQCRRWAISLVSSCPLRPSRRLGACFLFTHTSLLLCRWKAGSFGICAGVLLSPTYGMTLLQWQQDINREISNLRDIRQRDDGYGKEMLAQPQMMVSANATGVLTSIMHYNNKKRHSKQFSWLARKQSWVVFISYRFSTSSIPNFLRPS